MDEKWFQRLSNIHDGVPVRFKISDFNNTREAFFNNNESGPDFVYQNIRDKKAHIKLDSLKKLKSDIENCPTTASVVKELYFKKINEKISLINLIIKAELLMNSDITDSEEHVNDFRNISDEIFGKIKPDTFFHTCSVLNERLSSVPSHVQKTLGYIRLKNMFDSLPAGRVPSICISPMIPDEGSLLTSRSEIKKRFIIALEENGLDNWRVVSGHSTRSNFVVKTHSRRIILPNETALNSRRAESVMTERNVDALIEHELTHILRYENGLRSPLKLLAIGLNSYIKGEEGVATYREQIVKGATDYSNGKSYFAAGVAMGLDRGGKPRTFREGFEIMHDFYKVYFSNENLNASNIAFGVCAHLFKGTNGKIPGLFLSLQCSYRDGNIGIHSLLHDKPRWAEYLLIGKFDPTNDFHTTALSELGIIPKL